MKRRYVLAMALCLGLTSITSIAAPVKAGQATKNATGQGNNEVTASSESGTEADDSSKKSDTQSDASSKKSETEVSASSEDESDVVEYVKQEDGSVLLTGFPHIYQMDSYPTGCESVATVCALQYMGVDITVEDFIDNYLPKAELKSNKAGETIGPSLEEAFIGDPYSYHGCGCYPGAIKRALLQMKTKISSKYNIKNLTGFSLHALCEQYIDQGIPVIFWATCCMSVYDTDTVTWKHQKSGNEMTFPTNEHCLVLIGYDDDGYYFSDSLQYEDITYYSKEEVTQAYQFLGKRALAVIPKNLETFQEQKAEEAAQNPDTAATYKDASGSGSGDDGYYDGDNYYDDYDDYYYDDYDDYYYDDYDY